MAESGCLQNVRVSTLNADTIKVNNGSLTRPTYSTTTTTSISAPNATAKCIGGSLDIDGFAQGTVIRMYLAITTEPATATAAKKEIIGIATSDASTATGADVGTALLGGTISGANLAADTAACYTATVVVMKSAAGATDAPAALAVTDFCASARLSDGSTTSENTTLGNSADGKLNNNVAHKFLMWTLATEADVNVTNITAVTTFEVIKPADIN